MTRFETEVHEMMQYYGVTEKEAELKRGTMVIFLETKRFIIPGQSSIIFRKDVYHSLIG